MTTNAKLICGGVQYDIVSVPNCANFKLFGDGGVVYSAKARGLSDFGEDEEFDLTWVMKVGGYTATAKVSREALFKALNDGTFVLVDFCRREKQIRLTELLEKSKILNNEIGLLREEIYV